MLALALEKLNQTGESFDVHIYLDTCSDDRLDEVGYVRDHYFPTADVFRAGKHIDCLSGCWNILHALKGGYDSGAERVFLVEEDVMVYPNFFDFHWRIARECFDTVTCGRYIERYGENYYTNPGSCVPRHILKYVIPHINDEFFQDRRGYLDRKFGVLDDYSDLDDGLIRRVLRKIGARIVYPEQPVAVHQGYHQYGRSAGNKTYGTIEERIGQLRSILANVDVTQRYYRDFEPYDSRREKGRV